MPLLVLFYRLMVRPLFPEPVRSLLTILAIALGVAVVLAIDLAGGAATGSFRSSMETLAGDNHLELVTAGGVQENVVGTLATLPYSIRASGIEQATASSCSSTIRFMATRSVASTPIQTATNPPL